jgi:hypothetical protein
MMETKEKIGFQFKSRYLIGILGIAVGIYGIVNAINKRNQRKRVERTIQDWSDHQRDQDRIKKSDTVYLK